MNKSFSYNVIQLIVALLPHRMNEPVSQDLNSSTGGWSSLSGFKVVNFSEKWSALKTSQKIKNLFKSIK